MGRKACERFDGGFLHITCSSGGRGGMDGIVVSVCGESFRVRKKERGEGESKLLVR